MPGDQVCRRVDVPGRLQRVDGLAAGLARRGIERAELDRRALLDRDPTTIGRSALVADRVTPPEAVAVLLRLGRALVAFRKVRAVSPELDTTLHTM